MNSSCSERTMGVRDASQESGIPERESKSTSKNALPLPRDVTCRRGLPSHIKTDRASIGQGLEMKKCGISRKVPWCLGRLCRGGLSVDWEGVLVLIIMTGRFAVP